MFGSPGSNSRAFAVFILAALGLALFFTNPRITFIDDEVSIISAAAAPLTQTLASFQTSAGPHEHPPLYDVFLHFWLRATDGAFATLRLPAIVFYLCGLWLLARAAEEIGGPSSAYALLWLGVLWPFGYHFGRLAGWYSFCFLVVAALTLAYLHLRKEPSAVHWTIAMLCAIALAYTNYFGWAMLACLAFDYVLQAPRAMRGRAARQITAAATAMLLLYLPLWHAFFAELREPHFSHSAKATVLLGAFTLYSAFVSESVAPWNWALGVPVCVCIAAILALALKSAPPQARRLLLYSLALMAAMTVIGIISTKRLLPVAAWIILPLAVLLGVLPRGRERAILLIALQAIACVGWFGIFSRKYYSAPRFIEPWPRVAAVAANRVSAGGLVIANNPSLFFYLAYELHPEQQRGGWERLQNLSDPGVFSDDDWNRKRVPLPSQVLVIRGAPALPDPDPSEEWLDSHCRNISERFLLSDPASSLKATYMPELGDLPWRIHTVDYFCPPGLETPADSARKSVRRAVAPLGPENVSSALVYQNISTIRRRNIANRGPDLLDPLPK